MQDAMKNNGRKSDGTFGKGNQCAKKDITKEMAQHVTWRELHWAANTLTTVSLKELRKANDAGLLANESVLTSLLLKKAVKGDFKPIQFLIEMILGKPKQQIDQTTEVTEKIVTVVRAD